MTETPKMSIQFPEPARISRLQLPERKAEIGMSLGDISEPAAPDRSTENKAGSQRQPG